MSTSKTTSQIPFSCSFTPSIPELLSGLNCSITLTTYQAGKLVIISPTSDGKKLITLPRTFRKPMGVSIKDDKMVIATIDEVIVLENSRELAEHYPNKKNTYDSLWIPKKTFYTGRLDLHDVAFGKDGVYAVNTAFSCICKVGDSYNFIPVWQPDFITDLVPEDRCHLNGLAMKNGLPKYVTALGNTNTRKGWRNNIVKGGMLIDVETNEALLDQLSMPHSPKLIEENIYFLQSASGVFSKYNTKSKTLETIVQFEGFCRGLDIIGDYAFIGFSKLRKSSSTFNKLSFSEKADFSGIKVVYLPTKQEIGEIVYQNSVEEIYEVCILQNMIRPNVLNTINPVYKESISIPGKTFWAKPQLKKQDD